MRRSKKILVTSLAATTFALVSFSDTMGMLPFSSQKVSAKEKDASKNGKIVKEKKRTTHRFFLRFTTARRCVGRIIGISDAFASSFCKKM